MRWEHSVPNLRTRSKRYRTPRADAAVANEVEAPPATGTAVGGASSVSDADAAHQIEKKENTHAWKAGVKFNNEWNGQQRTNYNRLLKARYPNEHKRQQKAFFQKSWKSSTNRMDRGAKGMGIKTTIK